MADFVFPACRIAARCCACRTASGPGPVTAPTGQIDEASLKASVFARADHLDTLLDRHRREHWPCAGLRCAPRLRAGGVVVDAMQTGPAIRIYNIMMGERRRVAAALIAVP